MKVKNSKNKKLLLSTFYFLLSTSRRRRGAYLPVILMASVLFIAFATAIISLSISNIKIANLHNKKITSMSIAEAGVNYYLWHLSHDSTDYCDGQTCVGEAPYGPFTHDYKDQSGNTLGTFELTITPPVLGDATTTVQSIGKVSGESPRRTVIATIGMPSFTKYTLMVNGEQLWIGLGEKIEGTVHVNGSGMYNDGEVTNDASSTEETYNGWFGTQPGVAGPGIYGGTKLFPVPPVDFNQVDVDMRNLRDEARDEGIGDYYDSSGSNGYHIVLQSSAYQLFRVTNYQTNRRREDHLAIRSETLIGTYDYPTDGIIFLEDNTWVEGQIDNQQVTIVASDPEANGSQKKRIIIPNSILYTSYDGSNKVGLITQTDILLTRNTSFNIEIDAAMIAKDGEIKIGQYCDPTYNCSSDRKGNIRVYGSMAHNTGLIWTYDWGYKWSGYETTETIIDSFNVVDPPPKFPLTGAYAILSWREE